MAKLRFSQAQRAHERHGIIQMEQEKRFLRHYALLTVLEEQGVNLRGPVPQWEALSEDMREALRIMIFVIYFEGPGQLYLQLLARRQDRAALTEMRHYWQDLQLIAA
ncbi:hypothetical protein RPE78_11710 [Thioclava litoralis]|uniref:Uncharacterized protein n=1 Tax=Thioclava litoralis TaxID=3076557 RepID=A0ABZ1DY50_9RHOB|nr:hypothetical protein RPE78_11710 [Thioclava sp. FTW29]